MGNTTILVNNYNAMLVTKAEQIMQHSKNVHNIIIYVPKTYNNFDMSKFMATIEIVPPNQAYRVITLEPEDNSSKEGYLEYILELTADYTLLPGDLKAEMTFTYTDTDTEKTYVRHTTSCTIPIVAIEKWNELITDSALTALDQRLVQIKTGIDTMNTLANAYNKTKADNVAINDDGDLQLKSNGLFIGDAVPVVTPSTIDDEDDTHDGIIEADEIYI